MKLKNVNCCALFVTGLKMLNVASVAVFNEGKMLFGIRNDDAKWNLIGGKLNPGEDPQKAAIRELYEETNLEPASLEYLGAKEGSPGTYIHCYKVIVKDPAKLSGKNDPDKEFAHFLWVPIENGLPKTILANLHSPKNATLQLLGLQPMDIISKNLVKTEDSPTYYRIQSEEWDPGQEIADHHLERMSKAENPPDWNEVDTLLQDKDQFRRKLALKMGSASLRHFLQALKDPSKDVQLEAIEQAGRRGLAEQMIGPILGKNWPPYVLSQVLKNKDYRSALTPSRMNQLWHESKIFSAGRHLFRDSQIPLTPEIVQDIFENPQSDSELAAVFANHPDLAVGPATELWKKFKEGKAEGRVHQHSSLWSAMAENPKTPPDVLGDFLHPNFHHLKEEVFKNPSLPDAAIDGLIARNPHGLSRNEYDALIQRNNLSDKHLAYLLRQEPQVVERTLNQRATDPRITSKMLQELVHKHGTSPPAAWLPVIAAVRDHKNFGPEGVQSMLDTGDPDFARLGINSKHTTREQFKKYLSSVTDFDEPDNAKRLMAIYKGNSPHFDAEMLDEHLPELMWNDPYITSMALKEINKTRPWLLEDRHFRHLAEEPANHDWIAKHQNVPPDVLDTVTEHALNHDDPTLFPDLVRNPRTPSEALRKIHRSGNKQLQNALTTHKNTPPDVLADLAQNGASAMVRNSALQHRNFPPEKLDAIIERDKKYPVKIDSILDSPALTQDHIRKLYDIIQKFHGDDKAQLENKLLDPSINTPPEVLHMMAMKKLVEPEATEVRRASFGARLAAHPNVHPSTLKKLGTLPEYITEHAPDEGHKESVEPKFAPKGVSLQKLRKIRDFIVARGKKELAPKDLPPGNYAMARLPNGNISADLLQKFIDSQPAMKFNVSHSQWTGAQRHSGDNSQVFQLNVSNDQVQKMKDAGVWGTFRRMQEAVRSSGHPATPTTIGWVRHTGDKDGVFIDEIQTDLAKSFVRQAREQARQQAERDAGPFPREHERRVKFEEDHAAEQANEQWPEAHHTKIKQILFGDRQPGEVLGEAFLQHLRDKGLHDTPVHIHTPESKASISLHEDDKDVPVHFKETYGEWPRKGGFEPATYGQLPTQSNPEHKEEFDLGTGEKGAAPTWAGQVRKSIDEHPQLSQFKDLEKYLKAAAFLSGKNALPEHLNQAAEEESEPVAIALATYGLENTEENRNAIEGIVKALEPLEMRKSLDSPVKITGYDKDAGPIAEQVQEAIKEGLATPIKPGGKHSKGSWLIEPKDGPVWFLKPGFGALSPAKGVAEEHASQSRREVAFYNVAKKWGLEKDVPRAYLLIIDGVEVAAMALLPLGYKSADKVQKQDNSKLMLMMDPYLRDGSIHKWGALDWILGNADRHGQNVLMSDEGRVALIDHGSAFAGCSFDPANDPSSFIPFYLRYRSPGKFRRLTPEERFKLMPQPSRIVEVAVEQWLENLQATDLQAILEHFGINPQPEIQRLQQLKELAQKMPITKVINALWAGMDLNNL